MRRVGIILEMCKALEEEKILILREKGEILYSLSLRDRFLAYLLIPAGCLGLLPEVPSLQTQSFNFLYRFGAYPKVA